MSMPSSRLLVATTAGSVPCFSSSSISVRCSRETEPWCARAISWALPGSGSVAPACAITSAGAALAGATSSPAARRPAERLLVEPGGQPLGEAPGVGEHDGRPVCGHEVDDVRLDMWPERRRGRGELTVVAVAAKVTWSASVVRSSTGTTTDRSSSLLLGGCTTVTGCDPPRKAATVSVGRTVADRPMRCAGVSSSSSSRSRESARCAPRLVPATAWTSSTMTVDTERRVSRAFEVSIR